MTNNNPIVVPGATSLAVNDLVLFTDNHPALVGLRDNIFSVMQKAHDVSFRPLLSRAVIQFSSDKGRNDKTRHVRMMTQAERDEYCSIYASRFPDWCDRHPVEQPDEKNSLT